MYRFRKENWARKVEDAYPKNWSTTYRDLGLYTDRHYVHDLGHDPHYVYDHETLSRYSAGLGLDNRDSDAYRYHCLKTPISSQSNARQPRLEYCNPFDIRCNACHSTSLCGCHRRGLHQSSTRRIPLPPLHLATQSTQLASEIQSNMRRQRPPTARTCRTPRPGVNERFLGFKYHGTWRPNRTALGYAVTH